MSNTNPDRTGIISSDTDDCTSGQLMTSTSNKEQPLHHKQLTSRYGIPLNRNPSLNSTASSTTNTTLTTSSKRSTTNSSKSSSSGGTKEKMSADEILSSTKYALSARKTWTKEELARAKNVKIVKSAKKSKLSLAGSRSPTKYNFPSREECLRRLGSPVKGEEKDVGRALQNKSVKRDAFKDYSSINEANEQRESVVESKISSPCLNENIDASASKQITLNDLDVVTTNNPESIDNSTNSSDSIKEPADKAISNLLETYSACLEGEKIPWEVVQLFPPLLDYLDSKDGKENSIHERLGQFVKSVESIKVQVMNRGINNEHKNEKKISEEEKLLRILQIQIWIRIMVWNFNKEEGLNILKQLLELSGEVEKDGSKNKSKKKKNKKKSKSSAEPSASQSFVRDIIMLFDLVPYVLPPSVEFSQWLKDTLTFGFQQSIPEFGMAIFNHFEVDFVNNPVGSEVEVSSTNEKPQISAKPVDSTDKSLAKGKEQQQAYFSLLASKPLSVNADGETATIGSDATIAARSHRSSSTGSSKTTKSDKEADATLFKTSVSLTATVPKRKENPFLKGSARGVYVGSHFSSKLSNISSLFREVKAPAKPKPAVVTTKRKTPPEQSKYTPVVAATMAPANIPSNKTSSALAFINNKYKTSHQPLNLSSETPRKRLKPTPNSSFPDIHLPLANKSIPATPLEVIGETPSKPTRLTVRHNATYLPYINNNVVGATPLQVIGETPAKKTRSAARRLKPNALDGIFVRHSVEMTPRPQHNRSSGGLCFGLSPMPNQGNSPKASKTGKEKWR